MSRTISAFSITVLMMLLAFVTACHADDPLESLPGGKNFVGIHTPQPVYPEAAKFPYIPRLFERESYTYDMPFGEPAVIYMRIDWMNSKLQDVAAPIGDWKIVYAAAGGTKAFTDRIECEATSGTMIVMVYNARNPRLCWVDQAELHVTWPVQETPALTPELAAKYGLYKEVYDQLANSIIDWRQPKYLIAGTSYEMPERMVKDAFALACDKGLISSSFLIHLNARLTELSNGRYRIYKPTDEEYTKLGGSRCRCPFNNFFVREDKKTGNKAALNIHSDGGAIMLGPIRGTHDINDI